MEINLKKIAGLAKIQIDDDDLTKFESQMQQVMEIVDSLPAIDDSVKLVDENNIMELRKDDVMPSLSRDEVLKNAPQKQAGCIVVPKTVG